jgi:hypothetical protein
MSEWTTKTGLWQKVPWLLLFVGVFALLVSLLRGESTQDRNIDEAHKAVIENSQAMKHIHADLTELKRIVEAQCKEKKGQEWR